jgi:hypothetical protein
MIFKALLSDKQTTTVKGVGNFKARNGVCVVTNAKAIEFFKANKNWLAVEEKTEAKKVEAPKEEAPKKRGRPAKVKDGPEG